MSNFSVVGHRPIVDSVHADCGVTPVENTHEHDEPPVQSLVVREHCEVGIGLSGSDTEEEGRERRSDDESADTVICENEIERVSSGLNAAREAGLTEDTHGYWFKAGKYSKEVERIERKTRKFGLRRSTSRK